MNDLAQAPKVNLALNALLARLFRIENHQHLTRDEKAYEMLRTAKESSSLVFDAVLRTMLVDNLAEKTEANPEGWERIPYEDRDEQVLVELHDGRLYAFSLGHPDGAR